MKNYGIAQLLLAPWFIVAAGITIPIFIFGIGASIKALKFIYSPVTSGSIPAWSLFAVGGVIIIFMKRRQRTGSYI